MESSKKPDDTWTLFATSIFRLNALITDAGEAIARPVRQTAARWHVLGQAFEPQTVAAIARNVGQSRQNIQRIADSLVREGLVEYSQHPTDKRTKLLCLTTQGLAVIKQLYGRQLMWSEDVRASLEDKEVRQVAKTLQKIGNVIDLKNKEKI